MRRVTKFNASQYNAIQVNAMFSHSQKMNADESALVNQELENMLQKGAIRIVSYVSEEFLRKLSLVDKSSGLKRPAINLKNLNSLIS